MEVEIMIYFLITLGALFLGGALGFMIGLMVGMYFGCVAIHDEAKDRGFGKYIMENGSKQWRWNK